MYKSNILWKRIRSPIISQLLEIKCECVVTYTEQVLIVVTTTHLAEKYSTGFNIQSVLITYNYMIFTSFCTKLFKSQSSQMSSCINGMHYIYIYSIRVKKIKKYKKDRNADAEEHLVVDHPKSESMQSGTQTLSSGGTLTKKWSQCL